jgi:hypothetical protein
MGHRLLKSRRPIRRIPKVRTDAVSRAEYNALVDQLNERGRILDDVQRALQIQFQRIAQIQAELDELRAASKTKSKRTA